MKSLDLGLNKLGLCNLSELQLYVKNFDDIAMANFFLAKLFKLNIRHYSLGASTIYVYNYEPESDMGQKICREANGLMLDGEGEMVCRPLDYTPTTSIIEDLSSKSITKYTMEQKNKNNTRIIIYNYKGEYHIATRRHPLGLDVSPKANLTYDTLVKSVLKSKYTSLQKSEFEFFISLNSQDSCFIFDLVSEEDEEHIDLDLIEVIDKKTGLGSKLLKTDLSCLLRNQRKDQYVSIIHEEFKKFKNGNLYIRDLLIQVSDAVMHGMGDTLEKELPDLKSVIGYIKRTTQYSNLEAKSHVNTLLSQFSTEAINHWLGKEILEAVSEQRKLQTGDRPVLLTEFSLKDHHINPARLFDETVKRYQTDMWDVLVGISNLKL